MSSPVPPARLHPREWLLLGRKTWFSWCLMLLNLPLQKILLQSWLWSFSISMLHACYMKQRSSKFWLPAHSAEQKIHEKTVSQGCYQKESLAMETSPRLRTAFKPWHRFWPGLVWRSHFGIAQSDCNRLLSSLSESIRYLSHLMWVKQW